MSYLGWFSLSCFGLAVVLTVLRFILFGTPWRPDSPYRSGWDDDHISPA